MADNWPRLLYLEELHENIFLPYFSLFSYYKHRRFSGMVEKKASCPNEKPKYMYTNTFVYAHKLK